MVGEMSLLEVRDLGVRFGRSRALSEVGFEVKAGQIVSVFGKSGAGKSALAMALSGEAKLSSGQIVWDEAIDGVPCGVAFQKPALAPELSAIEFLDMMGALQGMPRKSRTRRIAFLIELLKLSDYRSRRASELPWQAQQRLELARAMLADPPLLVVDGLFDCMDNAPLIAIWEHLVGECRGAQKSVLLLTSTAKVAQIADQVGALIDGRLRFFGAPDDMRRLGGEDVVVVSEAASPQMARQIGEGMAVKVWEEGNGFAFRAVDGELAVGKVLAEHKQGVGAVYLRRPTLDDALETLGSGS